MSTAYLDRNGNEGADRVVVSPQAIAQAWLAVTREIPPQFAVGTARHETNYCTNERDVEPSGHTTGGVFQLDVPTASPLVIGDAIAAGMPDKSVYDLDDACAIFAARCSSYLAAVQKAADDFNATNDLPAIDWTQPPPDVWAYVAIAHNQGKGAAVKTISTYGLDWNAYKARNAGSTVNIAIDRGSGIYGDDVITGGADWDESYADASAIPAPTFDAGTSSRLRLSLLALLLALLVAELLLQKGVA